MHLTATAEAGLRNGRVCEVSLTVGDGTNSWVEVRCALLVYVAKTGFGWGNAAGLAPADTTNQLAF